MHRGAVCDINDLRPLRAFYAVLDRAGEDRDEAWARVQELGEQTPDEPTCPATIYLVVLGELETRRAELEAQAEGERARRGLYLRRGRFLAAWASHRFLRELEGAR